MKENNNGNNSTDAETEAEELEEILQKEHSLDKIKGRASFGTRLFLFFHSILVASRDMVSNFGSMIQALTGDPVSLIRGGWSLINNIGNVSKILFNFFDIFKKKKLSKSNVESNIKKDDKTKDGFFKRLWKKVSDFGKRVSKNRVVKGLITLACSKFVQASMSVSLAIAGMLPPTTPIAIVFNSVAIGVVAFNILKGALDKRKNDNLVKQSNLIRKIEVIKKAKKALIESKIVKNNPALHLFIKDKIGKIPNYPKIDDTKIKTSVYTKVKVFFKSFAYSTISTYIPLAIIALNKTYDSVGAAGLTSGGVVATAYTFNESSIIADNTTLKDRLTQQNTIIANNNNIKDTSISALKEQLKNESLEIDNLYNLVNKVAEESQDKEYEKMFSEYNDINRVNHADLHKPGIVKRFFKSSIKLTSYIFKPLFENFILREKIEDMKNESDKFEEKYKSKLSNVIAKSEKIGYMYDNSIDTFPPRTNLAQQKIKNVTL